jgi:hypothetical protein
VVVKRERILRTLGALISVIAFGVLGEIIRPFVDDIKPGEFYAISAIQYALLLALLLSGLSRILTWRRRCRVSISSGAQVTADLTVRRGEPSMASLDWFYGVATVFCGLAVVVSSGQKGYKALWVVIEYAVLTYLYLDSWFRDSVFFPTMRHVRQD